MRLRVHSGENAVSGFKGRKSAQIASYFAALNGKPISKLKLIKLIYLAERECMARFGRPMIYDELYSLPQGPICSNALNNINEANETAYWREFIHRSGNNVQSKIGLDRDLYDEISNADIDILNAMWERFGWMTASQVRNFTHRHCPEYTEIEQGRVPISHKEVFEALGEQDAETHAENIQEFRRVSAILSE